MSDDSIPQDVRRFIAEHILSVVILEALLLMHSEPERQWSAAELSTKLQVDAGWTQRELARLARSGVVSHCDGERLLYVYKASNAMHSIVSTLAATYAERRVSVISAIFSKPTDAVQNFADAFKIRKDPHDG